MASLLWVLPGVSVGALGLPHFVLTEKFWPFQASFHCNTPFLLSDLRMVWFFVSLFWNWLWYLGREQAIVIMMMMMMIMKTPKKPGFWKTYFPFHVIVLGVREQLCSTRSFQLQLIAPQSSVAWPKPGHRYLSSLFGHVMLEKKFQGKKMAFCSCNNHPEVKNFHSPTRAHTWSQRCVSSCLISV